MVEIKKNIEYTPIFERNKSARSQVVVNVGGAGSSKSHSLAQLFIEKLFTGKNRNLAVGRKTLVSLRSTAMRLIVDLLKEYQIYQFVEHNKTENYLTYSTNRLDFFGLDDPEKIKSTNYNDIWCEEGTDFSYEDLVVLKLRLRHPSEEPNQLFLSLNPIDEQHWIRTRLLHDEGVEVIHSTYHDNPFLSQQYIATIENLINEDENFYRVYALGEWGKLEHLVYRNWKIVDAVPGGGHWAYGLDFGYVNPSAIVRVTAKETEVYWEECLYNNRLTVSNLIEAFSHLPRGDIYADPTEKQMLEEIKKAGYNCIEATRDVGHSLDVCKRLPIRITKDSANIIKEISGYQNKVTKEGIVLDEPVKYNDHAMDAGRYAQFGVVSRFGFATATPGGNEPRTAYRR